jgi:hypothetical protein
MKNFSLSSPVRNALFLGCLLFVLSPRADADAPKAFRYNYPSLHFLIVLGNGWVSIPSDQAVSLKAYLDVHAPAKSDGFSVFQASGQKGPYIPYMIIASCPMRVPGYEAIEKSLANHYLEKGAEKAMALLPNASHFRPDPTYLDREKNIIFGGNAVEYSAKTGVIHEFTAQVLGKDHMVNFNLYCPESQRTQWEPVFRASAENIRFEPDHAYDPVEAAKPSPMVIWGKRLQAWGLIGVLVGTFFWLMTYSLKKTEKTLP